MRGNCIDHGQKGNAGGYGHASYRGKTQYAHRVAYVRSVGCAIADILGKVVLHECDNPRCVNPTHLKLGTHQDNTDDMITKGRQYNPSGEDSSRAILTQKIADSIRVRYKPRCKVNGAYAMSREFNVSNTTVRDIVKNRTWVAA